MTLTVNDPEIGHQLDPRLPDESRAQLAKLLNESITAVALRLYDEGKFPGPVKRIPLVEGGRLSPHLSYALGYYVRAEPLARIGTMLSRDLLAQVPEGGELKLDKYNTVTRPAAESLDLLADQQSYDDDIRAQFDTVFGERT